MKQQIAHHTITGCNMRPGDLIASGTISGKVGVVMGVVWYWRIDSRFLWVNVRVIMEGK